jgi:hypothetical protein
VKSAVTTTSRDLVEQNNESALMEAYGLDYNKRDAAGLRK